MRQQLHLMNGEQADRADDPACQCGIDRQHCPAQDHDEANQMHQFYDGKSFHDFLRMMISENGIEAKMYPPPHRARPHTAARPTHSSDEFTRARTHVRGETTTQATAWIAIVTREAVLFCYESGQQRVWRKSAFRSLIADTTVCVTRMPMRSIWRMRWLTNSVCGCS